MRGPDPAAWAATHDDRRQRGRGFTFRQGVAEAVRACLETAHPAERWIDVGCGAGHVATRLAAAGLRVTGVDADPRAIALARTRASHVAWTVGDAARLPLADASADGVVAVSLAGCLDDLGGFLREARRVLRHPGRLVLTVTSRRSLLLRVNGLIARLEALATGRPRDPFVYRSWEPGAVVALLNEAGLPPRDVRFYGYVVNLGPWLVPPGALASALRRRTRPRAARSRLARNFLVVAETTPARSRSA